MTKEKRKPLGSPLDRSDETIDAISTVTPALEAEARDWWREDSPPGLEGTVDAVTEED